jgi:hypothetical protein
VRFVVGASHQRGARELNVPVELDLRRIRICKIAARLEMRYLKEALLRSI